MANAAIKPSILTDREPFFERIVAPVKPAVIVIYAGDNDIAQKKTPQAVAFEVARFRPGGPTYPMPVA